LKVDKTKKYIRNSYTNIGEADKIVCEMTNMEVEFSGVKAVASILNKKAVLKVFI
jgi:hypothetical protein